MFYFSAKHATLRSKNKVKDWLVRNQDNVSVLGTYKNLTKHVGLVQSGPH
jgi:hypothetical protein